MESGGREETEVEKVGAPMIVVCRLFVSLFRSSNDPEFGDISLLLFFQSLQNQVCRVHGYCDRLL